MSVMKIVWKFFPSKMLWKWVEDAGFWSFLLLKNMLYWQIHFTNGLVFLILSNFFFCKSLHKTIFSSFSSKLWTFTQFRGRVHTCNLKIFGISMLKVTFFMINENRNSWAALNQLFLYSVCCGHSSRILLSQT